MPFCDYFNPSSLALTKSFSMLMYYCGFYTVYYIILYYIILLLFYIVGFELALVAAPRSLQTTAMGILFIPDGIANILTLVTQTSTAELHISELSLYNLTLYATHIPGMVVNIACLGFVVLMHRKFSSASLQF